MPSFRTPAAITRIRVHRKRGTLLGLGLGIEHYVFLVLYALALEQCYSTVGHPYAAAVAGILSGRGFGIFGPLLFDQRV